MTLAGIAFYDTKLRQSVTVPVEQVEPTFLDRVTSDGRVQRRFALRASSADGRWMTKFVGELELRRFETGDHAGLVVQPSEEDLALIPRLVVVRDVLDAASLDEELTGRTPREFEHWVGRQLEVLGWEVHVTPASRDGGIDIFASRREPFPGDVLCLVQCKHPERNRVGPNVVREMLGLVSVSRATKGHIVTSGFFTRGARKEAAASKHVITLHDRRDLLDWPVRAGLWMPEEPPN